MTVAIENLAKLRIAVARYGEMDNAKWWNTKELMSNTGELLLRRGFPKTHVFARARAVIAVAGSRSEEVYNPPSSYTLWHLPPEIEDQLEDAWSQWLEDPAPWIDFLQSVNVNQKSPVLALLAELELVGRDVEERANQLRRADDLKSVPIKLKKESTDEVVALLAAAYCCCEPGKLSVPFVRTEEFPR